MMKGVESPKKFFQWKFVPRHTFILHLSFRECMEGKVEQKGQFDFVLVKGKRSCNQS